MIGLHLDKFSPIKKRTDKHKKDTNGQTDKSGIQERKRTRKNKEIIFNVEIRYNKP